ncbi:MAG: type-F conjugative transfer system pilin assembly protein TrbC [Proteobacteria bacterium]|nr:type-F conjugative transfer system pilin assembly protein TrbC [Pseudomonadota bacterium]
MLYKQAQKAGAVLILRGLRDRLGTKGTLTKTCAYMMPVAKTGAAVQIDPEAFGRYNVSTVPTFVMVTPQKDGCNQDSCEGQFTSLVGDVTLDYALEYWSSQGGWVGQQADMFLHRLEGDKNFQFGFRQYSRLAAISTMRQPWFFKLFD